MIKKIIKKTLGVVWLELIFALFSNMRYICFSLFIMNILTWHYLYIWHIFMLHTMKKNKKIIQFGTF